MPAWMSWGLLIAALLLGVSGGVLAAKVAHWMFWLGWVPGLVLVGVFIYKSHRESLAEETADQAPEATRPSE